MRIIYLLSFLFFSLILTSTAISDTVIKMETQIGGYNIYGPTILKDQKDGKCKMWYMGWHNQSDIPGGDRIYYRENKNCNFSGTSHREVYNSTTFAHQLGQSPSQWEHTGDPSVQAVVNGVDGSYFYTMFFTACRRPCNEQYKNEIWSVVSSDGKNWHTPLQLKINGNASNYAQPTIVRADELPAHRRVPGQFWAVFFESRLYPDYMSIFHVAVDGNRRAMGDKTPVMTLDYGVASGAEVKKIGSKWHLWFHTFADCPHGGACAVDLHKVEASDPFSFGNINQNHSALIKNPESGGGICATETPGVKVGANGKYWLYFGLSSTRNPDGTCNNARHGGIHRWLWQD